MFTVSPILFSLASGLGYQSCCCPTLCSPCSLSLPPLYLPQRTAGAAIRRSVPRRDGMVSSNMAWHGIQQSLSNLDATCQCCLCSPCLWLISHLAACLASFLDMGKLPHKPWMSRSTRVSDPHQVLTKEQTHALSRSQNVGDQCRQKTRNPKTEPEELKPKPEKPETQKPDHNIGQRLQKPEISMGKSGLKPRYPS